MSGKRNKKFKYKFKWKEHAYLVKTSKDLLEICEKHDPLMDENKCILCPFGELCDNHKSHRQFGEDYIFAIINQENRKQKLEKLLT